MSCDCSNIDSSPNITSNIGLIINLFLVGISSSFSHCIAMCGSIAMSQAAMRLMQVGKNPNNWQKLGCCVSWQYYVGKAMTYCLLTLTAMFFGLLFKNSKIFIISKQILLLIAALYFALSAVRTIYSLISKNTRVCNISKNAPKNTNLNEDITNSFVYKLSIKLRNITKPSVNLNSPRRLLIGMLLGLIPCGVVYASIAIIIANSQNNFYIAIFASLSFGLGTFPGLFLLTYSGNLFFHRFRKCFDILYVFVLLWNVKILILSL